MHKKIFQNYLRLVLPLVILVSTLVLSVVALLRSPPVAAATGINEQVNYQGRLLTAAGAVAPDGTYNIEFKIYCGGDGAIDSPSAGQGANCNSSSDEHLEWTETRTGGNKVTLKNGYFSVYLGSVTGFSTNVDWNQQNLWLSINIGGTGAPSWDGEMGPYTRLSSTPYAFNAGQVGGKTVSQLIQLAPSASQSTASANALLNLTQTSTGNLASLDATDSSANGVLIDVQSSSASQYALKVTANNGANVAFQVKGDGSITASSLASCNEVRSDSGGTLACGQDTDTVINKIEFTGHSQTYGYGASELSQRWATKLSKMVKAQEVNRGISGASFMGTAVVNGGWVNVVQNVTRTRTAAPYLSPTNMAAIQLGTNDLPWTDGNTTNQIKHSLRTIISRYRSAAVFEAEVASGVNGITYGGSGTWSTTAGSANSGTGYKSNPTNGGTYTIAVPSDFPGGTVAIGLIGVTGTAGGIHTYTVDGNGSHAACSGWTFTGSGCQVDTRASSTGVTAGGAGVLVRFTNLSAGAHTIVGTTSSVTTTTGFDYWQIEAAQPPLITVLNSVRLLDYSPYATACSCTINDTDVADQNTAMQAVVNEFDSSVRFVDVDAAINKTTTYYFSDGIHFNDRGNAVIANTVYQAITSSGISAEQLSYTGGALFTNEREVFRNVNDSTAAFSIQNAAGNNLFHADTTLNTINIGRIGVPQNPSGYISSTSSGGLGVGAYAFDIAARDGTQESAPTAQFTVTISSGSNNTITLNWDPVPGATEYRVYLPGASGYYTVTAPATTLALTTSTPGFISCTFSTNCHFPDSAANKLYVRGTAGQTTQAVFESVTNNAVQFSISRNQEGGSYNNSWAFTMAASSKDFSIFNLATFGTPLTIQADDDLYISQAASAARSIEIDSNSGADSFIQTSNGTFLLENNLSYNGANWIYDQTAAGSFMMQSGGGFSFYTAPSGTAAATATVTERLSILNTGEVGVGDASPDAKLDVDATFAPATTGTTSNTARGVTVSNTVNKTAGSDTTLGDSVTVVRTGASGGTIDTIGQQISVTGDAAGAGTSTTTGLSVTVSGGDSVYSALFSGGNLGIGDTTPAHLLTVGSGDLFGVQSNGDFIWEGSTADNFETVVTVADPLSDHTYTIPDSTGNATDTFCLQTLANCGGGSSTLQQAYGNDANGSDTRIDLTTNDDSLIFSNPTSSGTDSAFVLKVEQLNTTGPADTLIVTNSGTGNIVNFQDAGTSVFKIADGGTVTSRTILPETNDAYDLGDNTHRWRDLYLAGDTIHLGTSTSDESLISYNTTSNSLVFKPAASNDSTTAMQFQNAAGAAVLTVDTTNSKLVVTENNVTSSVSGSNLLTGCTGTNWAGSGTGPYTNSLSTDTLTCTITGGVTAGATYQVSYAATASSTELFAFYIGSAGGAYTIGTETMTANVTASDTSNLIILPSEIPGGFASITSMSVKLVTQASAALQVTESGGANTLEIRTGGSSYRILSVGHAAGTSVTGLNNSAFGHYALQGTTSGTDNTAVGYQTLSTNLTGSRNTAVGASSLIQNTTGGYNTAIGYAALYGNKAAVENTAVGALALSGSSSSAARGNTAIGYSSISSNTSGTFNTAIGYDALSSNTSGTFNTAIGYEAGRIDTNNFSTTSNLSNASAIGAYAQVQASSSLVLGGQGSNQVKVGIGTTSPTNTLSVSPLQYSTGTASTTASATVVGSGTTWTSAMVGSEFVFANGNKYTVTGFTDTTHLTLSSSSSNTSQNYRIHYPALHVTTAGLVGIGTVTPTTAFHVVGTSTFNGDLSQVGNAVNALGDSGSMVPNGGFEVNDDATTTVADNWTFTQTTGSPTSAVETTSPIHGSRSMAITATVNTNVGTLMSACIPVSSSNAYTLSFRHRTASGSSTSAITSNLLTYTTKANCVANSSPTTVAGTAGATSNTTIAAHTSTVTPGATATWARVTVLVDSPTTVTTTFWIDSVSLNPTAVTTGIDLAENFAAHQNEDFQSGELVSYGSVSPNGDAYAVHSHDRYDSKLFGVVSTQPGVTLDDGNAYNKVTVALAGRVPARVNAENGAIAIGDPITASSTSGVGMKATDAGQIIGYAMSAFSGSGEGSIIVKMAPGFWAPTVSSLLQAESALFADLNVTGDFTIAGNTTMRGNLTVKGDTLVANLYVGGKLISRGDAPTSELGAALTDVLGASVTSNGTDTAGTITISSGSEAADTGVLAEVTFSSPYDVAPKIVISGNNGKSAKLGAYVVRTTNGFKIVSDDEVEQGETYEFDYIIIQAENNPTE